MQNYFGLVRGHTWSLAVEEHFYLALPLLLVFLPIRRRGEKMTIPSLPVIAIAVGVLGLAMRFVSAAMPYNPAVNHSQQTQWNIDAMFFGVLLAYVYQFHFEFFSRWAADGNYYPWRWCFCADALCHSRAAGRHGRESHADVSGLRNDPDGVHARAARARSPGQPFERPRARAVGYIGFYSYAIYLWFPDVTQYPIYFALEHHATHLPQSLVWLGGMAVYLAASVAVGATIENRQTPHAGLTRPLVPRSGVDYRGLAGQFFIPSARPKVPPLDRRRRRQPAMTSADTTSRAN